jgi:spore germination protein (amino acid permease)
MIKGDEKITQAQLMFLVLQTQVGVGILSLPHSVQAGAKGGAWISALIAGVVAQIIILIQWWLCKRFPEDTLFVIFQKVTGKWVGRGLTVLYVFYLLSISELILLLWSDVINRWVLMETPRWVTVALIVGTGMYLGKEKTKVIARFYVTTSFLVVLFLFVLIAYQHADFRYLFPVTEAGWKNITLASHKALIAMIGYEILLVLYPYTFGNAQEKLKSVSLGNFLVTLLYTFITFTSLIVFSPGELQMIPEPLLYMLKGFTLNVMERIDLFFLSIWVIKVLTSYVMYAHIAAIGVQELLKGEKENLRKRITYFTYPISYLIALFIAKPEYVEFMDKWIANTYYLFFAAGPLLLLVFSLFRRKGVKQG